MRAAKGELAAVHVCYFCGKDEDSCKHLFSSCVVVSTALSLFSKMIGYSLSPSALSTQDAWHLAFLCFDPLLRAQTHALVIFNWTVWIRRCKKYALCDALPVVRTAARDLAHNALSVWHTVREAGWRTPTLAPVRAPPSGSTGAAGRRTAEQTARALREATRLVDSIPEGAIIVYTDGGAAPNPGPAGAGALLIYADREVEMVAAIGHGTNNRGELWAVGMAARLLELRTGDTAAYFLSDSQHTLDLVEGRARPTLDLELVHAVRDGVRRLGAQRQVHFGKVAGH